MSITLTIDAAVMARFPAVTVRGFEVDGLCDGVFADDATDVRKVNRSLSVAGIVDVDSLVADQRIQDWREAIQDCGLKASRYKSSAEALAKRYLKGSSIATGVPAVDLYCALSAGHLAPLGAYDLDRLPVDEIVLRQVQSGDSFKPLGGTADDMPLRDRVVVYASASEIVCWAFNHRDSAKTCLQPGTSRAVFLGEAVTLLQKEHLILALADLRSILVAGGVSIVHEFSV